MQPETLDEHLRELAVACRVLAMYGHEDKTLGHLSLRDPQGRGLWLKRAHVGLAEIAGADDFVLIDFAGKRLAGKGATVETRPAQRHEQVARPDPTAVRLDTTDDGASVARCQPPADSGGQPNRMKVASHEHIQCAEFHGLHRSQDTRT